MLVRSLRNCPRVIANDGCAVFELLHPHHEALPLPYSFAVAEVGVGERSYRHRLGQHEVYYVLAGRGRMHVDTQTQEIAPGDAVVIPPGAEQWIENVGDDMLRFLAIVSPPWRAEDDERLEP